MYYVFIYQWSKLLHNYVNLNRLSSVLKQFTFDLYMDDCTKKEKNFAN